jgi:hypothetical protein
MLLTGMIHRSLEKILQLLDLLGCLVVPMKVHPIPEKCLIGTLNNFGTASASEVSLYREAFGDDTLRFASHEASYVIEGFS